MNKDLIEQIITEAKINNKYEKDVVNKYNLSPKLFSYYKRKYGLSCPKGKHLNSKNRRKHHIDDDFFSEVNELNSYWAGFIAADGNISKNNKCLTITLSIKDESILFRFLRERHILNQHNMPYQYPFVDDGLFSYKINTWVNHQTGETHIVKTPVVTVKGMNFIYKLLMEAGYVLNDR